MILKGRMMETLTIDTAMAKQLVGASALSGASIIGQPGGWSVVLKVGIQERLLGAQRSAKPRVWRSLDRCVDYLKEELCISRIGLLDATHFSQAPAAGKARVDASERLRNAHQAAAHDKWFRGQVAIALTEADSLEADWVSNEDASASWADKRAALAKQSGTGAA